MESSALTEIFSEIAKEKGFKKAFGGWYKESNETILTLNLQKSNYGQYFLLNIKIYIQGAFGENYVVSKDLIKKNIGHLFRRQPKQYDIFFDLSLSSEPTYYKEGLQMLFIDFLIPFSNKASSKVGIQTLADDGEIRILPPLREFLV